MSLRDLFKRYLPAQHTFREHRHIRLFGELLHDHRIWRLTRRSVAGGVAIGLACGFLPLFGQMVVAAAVAIYCRVNLPIAVVFTWISNPFTFAPMFYITYRVGSFVLDRPMEYVRFQMNFDWFSGVLHEIWLPLLIGSLFLSTGAAVIGYYGTNMLWRLMLLRKRDERKLTRPFKRFSRDSDNEDP